MSDDKNEDKKNSSGISKVKGDLEVKSQFIKPMGSGLGSIHVSTLYQPGFFPVNIHSVKTDGVINLKDNVGIQASTEHDEKQNTNDLLLKQVGILQNKQADLYKTIEEVRSWVVDSKNQSNRLQKQLDETVVKYNDAISELNNVKISTGKTKSNFDEEVKGFKKEISDSKNSVLGMIALFASFFSFISVSISVFSKEMTLSLSISIVFVLWICLVSFLYIFMVSLKSGVDFFTSKGFFEHFLVIAFSLVFAMVTPHIVIDKLFKIESVQLNPNKDNDNVKDRSERK